MKKASLMHQKLDEFDIFMYRFYRNHPEAGGTTGLSSQDLVENVLQKKDSYTKKDKRLRNRFYRERIGDCPIPYPEVDSLLERAKSRMIIWLCKAKIS